MQGYSKEYKEALQNEYDTIKVLYDEVLKQAGNGPYNIEEKQILSDYEDICEEYDMVFATNKSGKLRIFKRHEKEIPASKRPPIYCDNCVYEKREIIASDYVQLGGET